jgi:hypothetical protein
MRLLGILLFALGVAAAQSVVMTNQDVISMTKSGISANVIVVKISTSPCRFDTTIAALTSLKSAGVDDSVLTAMISCKPARPAHDKPYVWIGANSEWISRSNGVAVASASSSTAVVTGGESSTSQTHSEYADVARDLSGDKCPGIAITNNPMDADYAITIERYNAGHLISQRNSFSIFRASDGKLLLSNKTTWLKNATADMCKAIVQDSAPVQSSTPAQVPSKP